MVRGDVVQIQCRVICHHIRTASAINCVDCVACREINNEGISDAVSKYSVLAAAQEELWFRAKDDAVLAAVGDRHDPCRCESMGLDHVDLAAGIGIGFRHGDVYGTVGRIPGGLFDAIGGVREADLLDELAICHRNEGEDGNVVVRPRHDGNLLIGVVGHFIGSLGDSKGNFRHDGIAVEIDHLDAAVAVAGIQLIATRDVEKTIGP